MKKRKSNKYSIPEGHVGITIMVKVIDPKKPKKSHTKMEKFIALECEKYLRILFDPKVNKALFEETDGEEKN